MPSDADLRAAISTALDTVIDPEIGRPITELGMVESVDIVGDTIRIGVLLTISGCPMREEITARVQRAVGPLAAKVEVSLGVMTEEQRVALRQTLRGGVEVKDIPFTRPGNLTQILAIASGKGGVGKSSVTANLAAALAASGRSVGILDADVYGHSIPRLLGATAPATQVDGGLIMPPIAHGVRVMSVLPMKPGGVTQPVPWRGPMLHKVLEQFLTDVWWGDLDFLLLDLPPGTGDVAISVAQLLPHARLIVVTTPQVAATEVSVRAGMMAAQTKQRVAGVIENMSSFPCPHCGEPMDLFGTGGGSLVAEQLSAALGTSVPLLGRIPFDVRLREGGDVGEPLVLSDPGSAAGAALTEVAAALGATPRGLVGTPLGITPARR